jgi:CHAD domain-containing protein
MNNKLQRIIYWSTIRCPVARLQDYRKAKRLVTAETDHVLRKRTKRAKNDLHHFQPQNSNGDDVCRLKGEQSAEMQTADVEIVHASTF